MLQPVGCDYVLTMLLPEELNPTQLADLRELLASFGLSYSQERLLSEPSGVASVGVVEHQATTTVPAVCLELYLVGEVTDELTLWVALLDLAAATSMDIGLQSAGNTQRTFGLIVFDMDSTLIQNEVVDELARVAGVLESVASITEAAMNDQMSFKDSLLKRVRLLKGLPVSRFTEVSERLQITPGAEQLLNITRKLGMSSAIVSGGFRTFAEPIQNKLGIEALHAHELEIANDCLTGRVQGKVIDGEEKLKLLRKIAADAGVTMEQTVAVGDGANDIPMLTSAGLGIAYHAKPALRSCANSVLNYYDLDSIPYLFGLSMIEQRQLITHYN